MNNKMKITLIMGIFIVITIGLSITGYAFSGSGSGTEGDGWSEGETRTYNSDSSNVTLNPGTYEIRVYGGEGGDAGYGDNANGGGVEVEYSVSSGTDIDIYVGQQGGVPSGGSGFTNGGKGGESSGFDDDSEAKGGGGGGESAVTLAGQGDALASGGGGGGGRDTAHDSMTGDDIYVGGGGGGAGGSGGDNDGSDGGTTSYSYHASGGDGAVNTHDTTTSATSGSYSYNSNKVNYITSGGNTGDGYVEIYCSNLDTYDLTISISPSAGGSEDNYGVEDSQTFSETPGDTINLNAVADADYDFIDWSGYHSSSSSSTSFTMPEQDITVTASFYKPHIYDWVDLDNIRNYIGKDFYLEADLDENTNGYSSLVDTADGWKPIGDDDNPFTGSFDGQGYEINDLYIDRPNTNYVGLFGQTDSGATIENLGMVDINITGGDWNTGGLVGDNYGDVVDSYSTGSVTGGSRTGGLIGRNDDGGSVVDSYSTGDVTGDWYVGGLVGVNRGDVSDSYATGSVTGEDSYVGGLTGYNWDGASVVDSYSTGSVEGDSDVGGLIGMNDGYVSDSYWNTETSGQTESDGGEGRTTAEMTWEYSDTYVGWDMSTSGEDTWLSGDHSLVTDHDGNSGYPALSFQGEEAYFEVEITDTNSPVDETETLTVDANITNTGDKSDSQYIYLYINGAQKDSEYINNLGGGNSKPITLEWDTQEGDEGTYTAEVSSEDHSDTKEIEIEILEHELTLSSGEGGNVTEPGEGTFEYEKDSIVNLTATSDQEYNFKNWTGDVADPFSPETTIEIDSDKEAIANFEKKTYTLEINIGDGDGEVEIDPDQAEYEHGTEVTLTADPDDGWKFTEWTGDHTGTNEQTTITMDEDKEITAHFQKEKYTLTVNIEGEGEVEIDPDQTEYEHGTKVDLNATPEDEYQFTEWTGDTQNIGDTRARNTYIEMEDDYSITANFKEESDLFITVLEPTEEIFEETFTLRWTTNENIDNTTATYGNQTFTSTTSYTETQFDTDTDERFIKIKTCKEGECITRNHHMKYSSYMTIGDPYARLRGFFTLRRAVEVLIAVFVLLVMLNLIKG